MQPPRQGRETGTARDVAEHRSWCHLHISSRYLSPHETFAAPSPDRSKTSRGANFYKKTSKLNSTVLTGYLECHQQCAIGQIVRDLRKLELLQNAGVQNAKDTDGVVLAAEVELDSRCVACKERRVCRSLVANQRAL
jgi:hypothetical protein